MSSSCGKEPESTLLSKLQNDPPYTHNLLLLSDLAKLDLAEHSDAVALFNELMPLNIQARYPEDKDLLLKTLTKKRCDELYQRTWELHKWMKKLLK